MKKAMGCFLAVCIIMTQFTGGLAQDQNLSEEHSVGENALNLEEQLVEENDTIQPGDTENPELEKLNRLEEECSGRFIVKYKPTAQVLSDEVNPANGLETNKNQAIHAKAAKAFSLAKEKKLERQAVIKRQMPSQENALYQQAFSQEEGLFWTRENDLGQAKVKIKEWKQGYEIVELPEAVISQDFISAMLEYTEGVEYIQEDYRLEFAAADAVEVNLELDGNAKPATTPEPVIIPTAKPDEVPAETAAPEESAAPGPVQTFEPVQTVEPDKQPTAAPEETAKPENLEVTPVPEQSAEPTPEATKAPAVASKVAVIDGGVDVTHEAFTGRITEAWDFVKNEALTYDETISDEYYHGTHVAGIIAQTAPTAAIMPLKVFDQGKAYTSDIVDAIQYAQEHGAKIVNCSWGSTDNNQILKEAMEQADMFFVCAAGNNRMNLRETPIYPACFDLENILSVTSTNEDGGLSYYSNYGDVDIAARGRDVISAWPGNQYGEMSGTSMATGCVSGGAVLVDDGVVGLKARMLNTADRLSNLEEMVISRRFLNLEQLISNTNGKEINNLPNDDFDSYGYQRTSEENWELFSSSKNVQVVSGDSISLALKSNGTVWAWGNNKYGQLGDGASLFGDNPIRNCPEQISYLKKIKYISTQYNHCAAVDENGNVWTWGYNSNQQLGDGTSTSRSVPMKVNGINNVIKVSCGDAHTIVLKNDGTLWAWGSNDYGQLGDGSKTKRSVPVKVIDINQGEDICAGSRYTLAVQDGTVWSWGYNSNGQLGIGNTMHTANPQNTGLSNVQNVYANNHSMAIDNNGGLWIWGSGSSGQIGNGKTSNQLTPIQVQIPGNTQMAACGRDYSGVLQNDGSIWTWGSNNYGQLGSGSKNVVYIPSKSLFSSKGTYLSAGYDHMVAIDNNDMIYCWGNNRYGQLGGENRFEKSPIKINNIDNVKDLVVGTNHVLALKEDGTVWAWGMNNFGQLGDGSTISSHIPKQILGLNRIIAVAAGATISAALKEDGTVWVWGIAVGSDGDTVKTPQQVITLSDVKDIACGERYFVAVKNDGSAWAWGENEYGQLGDGTTENRTQPVQMKNISDAIAVSNRWWATFILKADGTVWACGGDSGDMELLMELMLQFFLEYRT